MKELKPLARTDLEWLLSESAPTCMSAYLPMIQAGQETKQNPIRFKNALTHIDEALATRGVDKRATKRFVGDLADRLDDFEFWQHQGSGLAIFWDGEHCRLRSSPISWGEAAEVGDEYYILPALGLLQEPPRLYVLVLSQHSVRLVAVSRLHAEELPLPDAVPRSLEQVVGRDTEESHLQFHSPTAGPGTPDGPIYHGHGGGKDDAEPELERFCRLVAEGVDPTVRVNDYPLVLAGDVKLTSIYAGVAPHETHEDPIGGNRDRASVDELHSLCSEHLRIRLASEAKELTSRRELLRPDPSPEGEESVLEAAEEGRVGDLLVKAEVDPLRFPASASRCESRANLAALATLRNSGRVHLLPPERFPNGGTLAAILRY